MNYDNAILSGLSLERDALPEAASGETSGTLAKLLEIEDLWTINLSQTPAAASDLNYVISVAENRKLSSTEKFLATRLLAFYYASQPDYERSIYYTEIALNHASSNIQIAECHRDIFIRRCLMNGGVAEPEHLGHYDQFVAAIVEGIRLGDAQMIHLGMESYLEQLGDYGVLAAAAFAWSRHPENQDAFEQEDAEARHNQYLKNFKKQAEAGFKEIIYTRGHGETHTSGRNRVEIRKNILFAMSGATVNAVTQQPKPTQQASKHWVCSACGHSSWGAEPANACAVCKAPREKIAEMGHASEAQQTRADQLRNQADLFLKKHPGIEHELDFITPQGLQEYTELGEQFVLELSAGNIAVMRDMIAHPALFEDMMDYMLLSAAALLWFSHPYNTDSGEKLMAKKQGECWLETSLEIHGPSDKYPLFAQWNRVKLPGRSDFGLEWTNLMELVMRILTQ